MPPRRVDVLRPESESDRRPAGVTILAGLFIAAGIIAALSIVIFGVVDGRFRLGLPFDILVGAAIPVLLLAWPGRDLLRGHGWAWFVVSLYFLTSFSAALFGTWLGWEWAMVEALGYADDIERRWLFAAAGLALAIGATGYSLCLLPGVRRYFDRNRRTTRMSVTAQATLCIGLLSLATWHVHSRYAAFNVDRLHNIGLAVMGDDDEFGYLVERLEQGGAQERIRAAWALGRSGRSEARPLLIEAALQDPDRDVRINAIAGAIAVRGEGVDAMLRAALDDEDDNVKAAGVRGLANDPSAVDEVEPLLQSDSATLRATVADALGRMGQPKVVPSLIRVAADPEEQVRSRVAFALGRLADPSAVATLTRMLDDERWEVRANAAQALGMIGDPSARPALERAADEPNGYVRSATDKALDLLR